VHLSPLQLFVFSYMILGVLTYLLVGLWFSQPLVVTGARDAFLTKGRRFTATDGSTGSVPDRRNGILQS